MSSAKELSERLVELRRVSATEDAANDLLDVAFAIVDAEPRDGLWVVWTELWAGKDDFQRRLLSFVAARVAERSDEFIWPVISSFLSSPTLTDQSTLINVVTAIQLANSDTVLARSVLSVDLNSFLLRCYLSEGPASEAGADLIVRLNDLGTLPAVLSTSEAANLLHVGTAISTLQSRQISLEECLSPARFAPVQAVDEEVLMNPYELPASLPSASDEWSITVLATREVAVRTINDLTLSWRLRREVGQARGMVQQLRLGGPNVGEGKVRLVILEGLLRSWHKLFDTAYAFAQRRLEPATEVKSARMFALTPQPGSYIVRLLVEHAPDDFALSTAFEESVRLAEGRPAHDGSEGDADAQSAAGALLHVLESDAADLTLEMVDRDLPIPTARSRILRRPGARTSGTENVTDEGQLQQEVVGVLDGANHRTGRVEILVEEKAESIHCDTPLHLRQMLVSKVIGAKYSFTLVGRKQTGDTSARWSVAKIDSTGNDLPLSEEIYGLHPSPRGPVSSDHIPQQDNLNRIVQVVDLIASGKATSPENMAMKHATAKERKNSERHIAYMKHAAKVLGLISESGSLLAAGHTLSLLSDKKRSTFLKIEFQSSLVGRAWMDWAQVSEIEDLDPETSKEFLGDRAVRGPGRDTGARMSKSMIERRGRTLRRWARDLTSGVLDPSEDASDD